jgi:hypothetical protein
MQQTDKQYMQDKIWGVAGTLLFHGLLLLLFIVIVFHTPIPPWPEEGGGGGGNGLEINLGTSNEGMGADQYVAISIPSFENKKVAQSLEAKQPDEMKSKDVQADDILTQENGESVSLPLKPDSPKKKTGQNAAISQSAQKEAVTQPVVNPNALYKKTRNTSDGATGKPGN